MHTTRSLSTFRSLLAGALLLLLAMGSLKARGLGPDTHTGLTWGTVSYLVGGNSQAGAAAFDSSYQDGNLGVNYGGVPGASAMVTDAHGNVYFTFGSTIYVLYRDSTSVPALLAAVTAQPTVGAVYHLAGAERNSVY